MTHTMKPDPAELHDEFELPPPDRLQAHYRRQLSAMLDGELSTDEGKFMQRRLEHDAALAACRERWQVCGDVMRGQPVSLLPADFADRVALALHAQHTPVAVSDTTPSQRRGAPRWAGRLALAASVAVVALFVGRQMPGRDDTLAGTPATSVAVEGASSAAGLGLAAAVAAPVAPAEVTLGDARDTGAAASAVVAVATLPLAAAGVRSRGQSQRAARRVRAAASESVVASAGASPMPVAADFATADQFFAQPIAPARPWPRAVLPAAGSTDRFSAGYPGSANEWPFPAFGPMLQPMPTDADVEPLLDAGSGSGNGGGGV